MFSELALYRIPIHELRHPEVATLISSLLLRR